MTSKDVRDILSLPDNAVAGPSAAQHRRPAKKDRPEGISRELFALIGDNAPSLAQAREFAVGKQAQGSYKERLGSRKKVRW
jgi:DNA methyltransferase 1-associated protein 1